MASSSRRINVYVGEWGRGFPTGWMSEEEAIRTLARYATSTRTLTNLDLQPPVVGERGLSPRSVWRVDGEAAGNEGA